MRTDQRRVAGRRQAWGRGPIILRFEPLEGRQLMSSAVATTSQPDLSPPSVLAPTLGLGIGQNLQVATPIPNRGPLDAGAYTVRFLLVGSDGTTTPVVTPVPAATDTATSTLVEGSVTAEGLTPLAPRMRTRPVPTHQTVPHHLSVFPKRLSQSLTGQLTTH